MTTMNDAIAKMLGLDVLSEEERNDVLTKIGDILFQKIVMRGIEMLSDEEKQELDGKAEEIQKDPATLFEFFEKKIPNFADVVKEEIESFKKRGVEFAEKTKE